MPNLKTKDILLEKTEDWVGPDDLYVIIDSDGAEEKKWGPRTLNDGEKTPIDIEVSFTRYASVIVVDEDMGGMWDPDLLIGKFDAIASEAGQGSITKQFQHFRARYTLTYEVIQ